MVSFVYFEGRYLYKVENGVKSVYYDAIGIPGDKLHMALSPDGKIYISTGKKIYQTTKDQPSQNATLIYSTNNWIRRMKIRQINSKNVLYFTADPESDGPTTIYRMDENNNSVPYHIVHGSDLKVPDPCNPGGEMYFGEMMGGVFDFDNSGNLYLSTGNTGPCGFYRWSGAGETSVTGQLERIYVSNTETCWDLEWYDANTIYYLSHPDWALPNSICRVRRLTLQPLADMQVYSETEDSDFDSHRGISMLQSVIQINYGWLKRFKLIDWKKYLLLKKVK